MRIIAWSINVVYEDGSEDILAEVPNYVASAVDEYLTEVEEEDESV